MGIRIRKPNCPEETLEVYPTTQYPGKYSYEHDMNPAVVEHMKRMEAFSRNILMKDINNTIDYKIALELAGVGYLSDIIRYYKIRWSE